jgi:flagella basal body P-ring formation protein FlgA
MKRFLFFLIMLLPFAVMARQDPAPVKQAIEDFLRVQTQGLPGQIKYTVGHVDPNNGLAPCASFEVSIPQGGRLWGRSNVVVRCQADAGWSLYVPVQVRVTGEYLVAARPLAQGQVVMETDLTKQSGDLTELPNGILGATAQAVGRTVARSIPAGRPLRADMLQQPLVVQQGQSVKVVSQGAGFQVANEGRALNNAVAGQIAQVRLGNGQVVSGVARAGGIVEISY